MIIAPKSVAECTWQDEAAKWDHLTLTFSTVLGTEKQRIKALQTPADCYVINRENVTWLCEYYRYDLPFDMLVIDESSSFKNWQSKRFRAIRKCLPRFHKIVILTGTPAPNTLLDLWAQMYLLDRGKALGKTIGEYRRNYFVPDKRNGMIIYSYRLRDEKAEKDIYGRIESEVMSLKAADYLQLPERIDNVIKVQLPERAKKVYEKMERELVLGLPDSDNVTAASAAALSNKLLQIANGGAYTDSGDVLHVHDAKLEALDEIVEANEGNSVLVFYSFRFDLRALKDKFPQAKELKSEQDIRDWNAGKIPVLLAHPASSGYGLNLQSGGHIIVWYGLTWSLELYQQANARLHRQGQGKPVIVHHLVAAGTIDMAVMSAIERKATGQDALLEAVKGRIAAYV